MDIKEELNKRAAEAEKVISIYLPKEEGYQKTVLEAMNYSINAGGKRLRPVLMNEMFHLFGGQGNVCEPFMAAMEMIHTYSLVHDDLPAMDNDMLRRGMPTTHAKYGEDIAILAGDGLLNYAYETAIRALRDFPENPNTAKALLVLAEKAGIYGMVGGQVVDVESEDLSTIEKEKLDFIYRLKTGALLEASMMIGAILAGASEENVAKVQQAAAKIGMAFQIRDDILDVVGDEQQLGKPIGSDERNSKTTYVTYAGLDQAERDVETLSEEAIELLEEMGIRDEFLEKLIMYLVKREK